MRGQFFKTGSSSIREIFSSNSFNSAQVLSRPTLSFSKEKASKKNSGRATLT